MMENAELNHERVLQTFYEVLGRDNSLSRCRAVKALERVDGREDESRKRLIELLMDPDPDVRTDAAVTLGRMRVAEATNALLFNLENDPDGEVRVEAVRALSGIGSREAVAPLIRCLEADGYPQLEDGDADDEMPYAACWEVHSQTLEVLGKLGDARATESVIALLENDEYTDLQERGYRVLAEIDSDRAREFLLQQLDSGEALARRRAARALTTLTRRGDEGENTRVVVVNRLTSALMDPDPGVRIYAARALSTSSNPLVVVPITMLLADPEIEVRKEVAAVLGRMRGREIVDRLQGLLSDPDLQVQRQVVRVLGEIGDPASGASLLPLLESEDGDVLHDVVVAVGKIGFGGAEAKLVEILADERLHYSIRVQAANALGELDKHGAGGAGEDDGAALDPSAILSEAVFDPTDAVAHAALKALVDIDGDDAVTVLSRLVRGTPRADTESSPGAGVEDPPEAEVAEQEVPPEVERLITGHDATTSTLAAMMTPPDQEPPEVETQAESDGATVPRNAIRILAARLLGAVATPGGQAVRDLIDAYRQGDDELRREIIVALGSIGDAQGLPLIVDGLAAEQHAIRSAALDALEGFPGESAADEHLVRLLDDENHYIRERAVQVIGAVRTRATLAALSGMLNDGNSAVCRAALRALPADMRSEGLSEKILDLMFRFSSELTRDAAAVLRRMDDWGSASRLVAILDDPEQEEFHWVCIDALAEMFARESGSGSGA